MEYSPIKTLYDLLALKGNSTTPINDIYYHIKDKPYVKLNNFIPEKLIKINNRHPFPHEEYFVPATAKIGEAAEDIFIFNSLQKKFLEHIVPKVKGQYI